MAQRATSTLSVLCTALLSLALIVVLQSRHVSSSSPTQLFTSKLPTPTPAATDMPAVPGLFISPLSTPAGTTIQAHLPLVYRQPTPTPTPTPTPLKYGWKGIGHPDEASTRALGADSSNGFWGINPDWWFDWGRSRTALGTDASAEEIIGHMAAMLAVPSYVPMVACTSDVDNAVAPEAIATLAADFPGRVWLMFNEPDNHAHSNSCGSRIFVVHDYYTSKDWSGLGAYLADEYAKYATAIIEADPTARVFTFAAMQLPMPGLIVPTADVDYGQRAIPIWNSFLTALASKPTPVPIHGIAIHAYPNNGSTFHLGPYRCNGVDGQNPQMFLDPDCVKRALESAYNYFEGVSGYGNPQPQLTQNKPIWLTETGILTGLAQLRWDDVQPGYQTPLMNWLLPRMMPTAQPCCAWLNAVAWYSTHRIDDRINGADHTASNLLVPTPVAPPALGALTSLGVAWRDMSCPSCACPGYDCQ